MPDYRASWYSQLPAFGWFDPEDRPGSNALGVSDSRQGIALPTRRTLGQWFNVTSPGGQTYRAQQTDVGPAAYTGRGVDISAALAQQMGYTPKTFPTDASFKVEPADGGDMPAMASNTSGKMPNGLLDFLQPSQPDNSSFGDRLAANSNSLIGMGMGLLQPYNPWAGTNAWSNALQGYQTGAALDQRSAALRQQQNQDAWRRKLAEAEFARSGMSEFQKMQADIQRYAGTPQAEEAERFYASKRGETPQLVSVEDPNSPGEKMSVLFNPRAPAGQQFSDLNGRPLNIGGATAAAAPGTSAPDSSIWTRGGGGVGYGQAGVGAGTFGPGAATTASPTPAPQDQQYRTSPKTFEPEQKLRKEFEDVAKPYLLAAQSYKKMTASQPTAAGDIALIFAYMKMLDPPSTVREGEFATAQNSGGVEDRIRNIYNKLLSGERLQPGQRADFMKQGAAVWDRYRTEYEPRVNQFSNIAKQYRIDPRRIIPDIGELPIGAEEHPAKTTTPPATAGTSATRKFLYDLNTGGMNAR
jgi:hypothetical protein